MGLEVGMRGSRDKKMFDRWESDRADGSCVFLESVRFWVEVKRNLDLGGT